MSARRNPAAGACPICGKPTEARTKPFCSPRCADLDLQHWLSDRYAIPVPDDEATDEPSGPANRPGQADDGSV